MTSPTTIRVQANPDKTVDGRPLNVRNPINGAFYPAGPFDLSIDDLRHPDVLRLFPRANQAGGRTGGVFADLVPVVDAPTPKTKG